MSASHVASSANLIVEVPLIVVFELSTSLAVPDTTHVSPTTRLASEESLS